jgi:hypothetical protein
MMSTVSFLCSLYVLSLLCTVHKLHAFLERLTEWPFVDFGR